MQIPLPSGFNQPLELVGINAIVSGTGLDDSTVHFIRTTHHALLNEVPIEIDPDTPLEIAPGNHLELRTPHNASPFVRVDLETLA